MQVMMTDSRGTTMVMMNSEDSGWWLVCINVHVLQGSEFRSATKDMGLVQDPDIKDDIELYDGEKKRKYRRTRINLPPNSLLSYGGFVCVCQRDLDDIWFWGITHDLFVLREPLPCHSLFEARFDKIYHSSSFLDVSVLETISREPFPNNEELSDHHPVDARFK